MNNLLKVIFWFLGVILVIVVIVIIAGSFRVRNAPVNLAPIVDCTQNSTRAECQPVENPCTKSADAWAKCYPGEKG